MEKGFSTRLKSRREALKITQLELSKRAGYANKASIYMLESDRAECPFNKAKVLADLLDVDVNWLLYGTGEQPVTAIQDSNLTELEREIVRLASQLTTAEKIDLINDLRGNKYSKSSKEA